MIKALLSKKKASPPIHQPRAFALCQKHRALQNEANDRAMIYLFNNALEPLSFFWDAILYGKRAN
jgi:hypothetical protein